MSVIDFGLGVAGVPEATIKEFDKQLPALGRIAAGVKELEPLLAQALPIITKMYPDIVAVTPLVQQMIAFAKQKEGET